jgi:TonB family protein
MKMSAKNGKFFKISLGAMKLQVLAVAALMAVMVLPLHAADDLAVKQKVAPVYPEIAKRMHIFGSVKVEATVDAAGKVTDVKQLSGQHMLSTAAEEAVRKWRFEPGAGDSHVELTFNFN